MEILTPQEKLHRAAELIKEQAEMHLGIRPFSEEREREIELEAQVLLGLKKPD